MLSDTIIVPDGGNCILYSPFSRLISSVPHTSLAQLASTLESAGFFRELPMDFRGFEYFKSLTLFLTDRCNLACRYCYASSTSATIPPTPPISYRSVVDLFIEQFQYPRDLLMVDFHGGGEQTLAFDLMKDVVDYARSAAQRAGFERAVFKLATNGIFDDTVLTFLTENEFVLGISLDGPPAVNDSHRTFPDGRSSTAVVERLVRRLVKLDYPFSLRATITNQSVDHIEQILQYFESLGARYIVLQPVTYTGRCLESPDLRMPSASSFATMLLHSLDIARSLGLSIASFPFQYIASGQYKPYCGSMGADAMVVTHDGYLTSCIEITSKRHPLANEMFVGQVRGGRLVLDRDKLHHYMSRRPDNISECRECFARYLCSSGCPIKSRYSSGTCFGVDTLRCEVSRLVLPDIIKRIYHETFGTEVTS